MPPRRRSIRGGAACLAVGLGTAALAGCTAEAAVREPGASVTSAEADVLSRLLQRNHQRGGADFVATAPYGSDVVLTLTGEVDFRRGTGRAGLVTSYGDTRADDVATVFFTGEELWIGDGARDAAFVRRPLVATGTADLVDVLVRTVLNLGRSRADDPAGFTDGDWTWQGQRSIDSRLSMLFAEDGGPTVAVDAADDLLLQYVSPVPGQSFEVTVTLADHGAVSVVLPEETESAGGAEQPELAGS